MSVAINVDNVIKKFGDNTIIPGMTVNIKNGEFFTLLGPSGCGKTTLLRMIAGFNSIEGGKIYFDGQEVNFTSPFDALGVGIGMVHQEFSLIPGFKASENVVLNRESTLNSFATSRKCVEIMEALANR